MVDRKVLIGILLLACLVLIGQQAAILVSEGHLTAKVGSAFSICVNHAPTLSVSCNTTIVEDVLYSCTVSANDSDDNTLSYNYTVVSGSELFTSYPNGTYTALANNSDVGGHVIVFYVDDGSGCANNVAASNSIPFTVQNTNDAPTYLGGLSTFEWEKDTTLRGIFLDDYFTDIDGDNLNYSASLADSGFTVTILTSSEILLAADSCGENEIIFTAIDPYNATVSSSVVTLNVPCEETTSGGGGGGGSTSSCTPEWRCDDWSRCAWNGTQSQQCTDINACNPNKYKRTFYQECEFIPHCEDGAQNFDEKGVDCGGSCPACQTCEDGILNNQEVEVDCGGPNCPACQQCSNGIQDYQETGVDCGGPYCDECASCVDGIQNQEETGVDCGGPNCEPCSRLETPQALSARQTLINSLLLGAVAIGIASFVAYKFFRKQITMFIANLLWYLLRAHRKETVLVADKAHELYTELTKLEKENLLRQEATYDTFQDALSRLVRQFYVLLIGEAIPQEEVERRIDGLKYSKRVKRILNGYYELLMDLERQEHLSLEDLELQLEQFRQRLISLTPLSSRIATRAVEEKEPHQKDNYLACKHLLYNATLALQFNEIELAKKKYTQALQFYNQLDQSKQEDIYTTLHLVFDDLLYVASYTPIH